MPSVETDDLDIEVEFDLAERLQLYRQQFFIPTGQLGQAVEIPRSSTLRSRMRSDIGRAPGGAQIACESVPCRRNPGAGDGYWRS